VRNLGRLVKKWEEQGLAALETTKRAYKAKHRIDAQWQKFIINTLIHIYKIKKVTRIVSELVLNRLL
jgi:phosphoribosylformylglycinamidine (FGAM) synthase PurS component